MTSTIDVDDVRARVRSLPALPGIIRDLLFAVRLDDLNLQGLARKVALDPGLAARLLRMANSAFYGMSGRIASVHDAIQVIGLRTVETLLMAETVTRQMQRPPSKVFDFRGFWEHSLGTAICAQELAQELGIYKDQAFTAGLVHDIGSLALASYYPGPLASVLRATRARDCVQFEAERSELGIDHAQVGGWIAEHWCFADSVAEAIHHHHAPESGGSSGPASLADIVHAADGIAHALDLHEAGNDLVPLLHLPSWKRLGLTPDFYLRTFAHAESAFREMRHVLQ
jgi:putative nucleotidyltransferase with HDIG domain